MNRRISSIRFAHRMRSLPDPTADAIVLAVWDGIQRTHGAPPEQSLPLMPPQLGDVIDACPTIHHRRGKPDQPNLAGLRDRALILTGFVAALRRSEIADIVVEHLGGHPRGMTLTIPHSKTDQQSAGEIVILPTASRTTYCPVTALTHWLDAAGVDDGPVFRRVRSGNIVDRSPTANGLDSGAINRLVQTAIRRGGIDPALYSAHSLRAGFVTYAHQRGASDRAIAHQTRHRSLASITGYVRTESAWQDNAATELGL